jgi:hypothetical protein
LSAYENEEVLESQLAKLKNYVDKGLLTNEAYLGLIAQLFEKFGFK